MTRRNRLFVLNDPHSMRVSKELAKEIGLNNSIVLLQVDFLLAHTQYVREGLPWIRRSTEELKAEYFDFWSVETVRRTIKDLDERLKLIRVANFNRRGFDRTQWITLNVEGCSRLKSLTITHFEEWSPGSAHLINSGDDEPPIPQDEESQVAATLPLDDPDLLTAVDDESPSPIPQNGESNTQNGSSMSADRGIETPDRVLDARDLGDASQQSGEAIEERKDLEKRLTSSGKDAARPQPKKISIKKLLAEALPRGRTISRNFKGHLGREMHKLARQGIDADVIRDAAKACIEKGLNPHNLPSLALEVRSTNGHRSAHVPFQNPDPSEYEEEVIR